MKDADIKRTIIFLHIPKTAGRTMRQALIRHYDRDTVFDLYGDRDVRELRYTQLPLEERENIRLIRGHMYFGIHAYVPHEFTYFTVLRNPVERVISQYYYVQRSRQHHLHQQVAGMPLKEYVSSKITLELDNAQVRALVGPEHLDVPYGQCTREMLLKAKTNLKEYFSVVGITERFDETLLLLRSRLGWRRLPFYGEQRNVTKARPRASNVSRQTLQEIEKYNELDQELYEFVTAQFAAEVERNDLGRELARFRAGNRLYSLYRTAAGRVRSTKGKKPTDRAQRESDLQTAA